MTQCARLYGGQVIGRQCKCAGCAREGGGRAMAVPAIQSCRYMGCWRIGLMHWGNTCKAHTVAVAARTIIDDTRMVHRRPGKIGELASRMAELTCCRSRQVVRWFGYWSDTSKYLAIVATGTIAEYAGMAHRRSGKIGELARQVAGFTSRAGRQVV